MEPDPELWSRRLRDLMHTLRWSGAKAAAELGVTETWVSRLRSASGVPSERTINRIIELEKMYSVNPSALEEEQSDYNRVKIEPRHALPSAEPTIIELRALFEALVEKARLAPGGIYNLTRALKRFEKDFLDPIE